MTGDKKIITIGTFDGVHLGHRKVLASLRDAARKRNCTPLVITFDRHPLETIHPERAPQLIMGADRRDELLRGEGMTVIRIEFADAIRRMTAREWLSALRKEHGAVGVVLGYDNRFGCDGRELDFEDFRRLGSDIGLEVIVAPEVEGCSSSRIRRAVSDGDMEAAAKMLGRPFSLSGRVGKGRQIGRTIGFPTANIDVDGRMLLPAPGVYAAEAETEGKTYRAVVNVGFSPTVSGENRIRVEAHLIGFEGNLYGKDVKVNFVRRIRDERKFPSLEALRSQIERDLLAVSE